MNENVDPKRHTVRRFKQGSSMWNWDDLQEKIFQADHSYKCPTYVHRTPPCQAGCPSGHDIRGWLAIARGTDKPPNKEMSWQEYAFLRVVEANPFPAVMGRVCPAPCEAGCNRNEVDDFVGINAVEQYVGDWAIAHRLKLPAPAPSTGKRLAIIGGGPAGLAAAYFLRRSGHAVVIFEAQDALGGMMRYGIPGYRTPRHLLDAEIDRIVDMGVEVRRNVRVGVDLALEDIASDFDAIFWAIGAQKGRPLPVPGGDAENCITGIEFLDAFNRGWVFSTARRIIVVGGGDTSIDVASVARRLGHISTTQRKDEAPGVGFTAQDVAGALRREGVTAVLTSLFPIEKMTATERERQDALREGIEIKGGVMPLEVIKDPNGRAVSLKMCACDMKGMTPIPRPGTEFSVECDMIISAIGQMGDMSAGLAQLDNGRGSVDVAAGYRIKNRDKHFAGGDIVSPHLLTTAIGHGRIAAGSIDRFLADEHTDLKRPKIDVHRFDLLEELHRRGLDPERYDHSQQRGTCEAKWAIHNYDDRSSSHVIPHDELFKGHFAVVARSRRKALHIPAEQVIGNFQERIEGLTEDQARKEGERCMSCGMCLECDNCVIYCPQKAVERVPKMNRAVGHYVYTDYAKCIGCHICKDVCPSGYIQMGLGE